MSVKAAMTGDVDLLKLAVLHDPLVGAICNPDEVWQMVDEMLVAQAQWLPQYAHAIPAAIERMKNPKVKTRDWSGAARLKVRPSRCVLVEDTLEHQKAARSVGMSTAWMLRYLEGRFRGTRRDQTNNGFKPREVGVHPCRNPPYVCAKIKSLQKLRAL